MYQHAAACSYYYLLDFPAGLLPFPGAPTAAPPRIYTSRYI